MFEIVHVSAEMFPFLLAIEVRCFVNPMNGMDITRILCCKGASCRLLKISGLVVPGFVLWTTSREKLEILRLAVLPEHRRNGVGTALVDFVKERAARGRSKPVEATVNEWDLCGQLFFSRLGFRAVEVLKNRFEGGHDLYRMKWKPNEFAPRNRIKEYRNAADL